MTGIKWSIKEEQGLGSLEPSMVATVRTGPDNKRFILVLDSGLKKSYCKKSGQNKPCSNGFARGEKKGAFQPDQAQEILFKIGSTGRSKQVVIILFEGEWWPKSLLPLNEASGCQLDVIQVHSMKGNNSFTG